MRRCFTCFTSRLGWLFCCASSSCCRFMGQPWAKMINKKLFMRITQIIYFTQTSLSVQINDHPHIHIMGVGSSMLVTRSSITMVQRCFRRQYERIYDNLTTTRKKVPATEGVFLTIQILHLIIKLKGMDERVPFGAAPSKTNILANRG